MLAQKYYNAPATTKGARMETAMDNEIKGKFSPLEVFNIGRAAQFEGYTDLSCYIRETTLKRVREIERKQQEETREKSTAEH